MNPGQINVKANIHDVKVMLRIWVDQKAVLYYEFLKPGETINGHIKNWLVSFLSAEPAQFVWNGVHNLLERWETVIASDEKYFE